MRLPLCLCLAVLCFTATNALAAPLAPPTVPEALKPLDAKIGGHWAFKGTVLSFKAEQPVTDEQWKAIESLAAGGVVNVYAGGKGIGDADFERFATVPLEGLSVDGATITDGVFASIAKMKTLKALGLSHAMKLTGQGATALAAMPALETISIGGTGFGDAGMAGIAAVKTLKKLNLNHDRMTDVGVAALANHPAIESFMISPQMGQIKGDGQSKGMWAIKGDESILFHLPFPSLVPSCQLKMDLSPLSSTRTKPIRPRFRLRIVANEVLQ